MADDYLFHFHLNQEDKKGKHDCSKFIAINFNSEERVNKSKRVLNISYNSTND
jgi:hypothetical protein